MMISIKFDIKIESVSNLRENWRARADRAKNQRWITCAKLRASAEAPSVINEMTVTITRIAPRLLDCDNMASGAKSCRDGIADFLRVKDNDKRITWRYAQEKGDPKEYAVRIDIEWSE